MTLNDPLANVLSHIQSYERLGKKVVKTKDNNKTIRKVLDIMKEHGYIGGYEEEEDSGGNILKINLIGKVNDVGVVKPRFTVSTEEYEKFEKRYLPAMGFGNLILTTNQGLMTNKEAKEEGIGGKLISYVY